jgi:hypothetical protein
MFRIFKRIRNWFRWSVKHYDISQMVTVKNLYKKPLAADKYNHMVVRMPDGVKQHLLFTDRELTMAIERANKNTEDLPLINWISHKIIP